ncbi:hypothetical protein PGQ11_008123 [Apiospora arundinis]|uniref:Uncharacterized protein n=1 Tax=Apiospora arundinis TaxID=335852 RepID=A0ABR2IE27_9PEZI
MPRANYEFVICSVIFCSLGKVSTLRALWRMTWQDWVNGAGRALISDIPFRPRPEEVAPRKDYKAPPEGSWFSS